MSDSPPVTVQHDRPGRRFIALVEGHLAHADYTLAGERMTLTHTLVPPALRGRGVAAHLIEAALADARARNLRVDPQCTYVSAYIERNPRWKDLVA